MKKLLFLILFLPFISLAQSPMSTDNTNNIKLQSTSQLRSYNMFQEIIDRLDVQTATGTNTYVISGTLGITSYSGLSMRVLFTNGNTASSTLNVNSLGAKTLKNKATGANLASGDLVVGGTYTVSYDGSNLQVDLGGSGGGGTVSTVSVVSANGLAGTVANPTTTPAITLSTTVNGLVKGNGTAFSAASAGTDYLAPLSNIFNGNSATYGCTPNSSGYDNSLGIEKVIQDAFAFAIANNQVAIVEFDNGEYYCTRALQTTSNAGISKYYCQIPLPFNSVPSTGIYPSIIIRPKSPQGIFAQAVGTVFGNLNNGVTFRSTLASQSYSNTYGWPSMFGGPDAKQGAGYPANYSFISLEFQNITFKLPGAPTLACVNDLLITRMTYENVQGVVQKSSNGAETPNPTSPLGIFNFGPAWNNNTCYYKGYNFFAGLYAGPSLVEHTIQDGIIAVSDCVVGLRLACESTGNGFFHSIALNHLSTEGVLYGFAPTDKDGIQNSTGNVSGFGSSSGIITMNCKLWELETTGTASWNNAGMAYYIYDVSDVLSGIMNYSRGVPNVGSTNDINYSYPFLRRGASRMVLYDLFSRSYSPNALSVLEDNFYRADNSSVIGNLVYPANIAWTQQSGTWGIIGNKAYCSSAISSGGTTLNRLLTDSNLSDVTVISQFTPGNATSSLDFFYRYSDTNNLMICELRGSAIKDVRLYKKVAGTVTQIGSTYIYTFPQTPYEIKIVASGTSHTVYLNGVSIITATESANQTNTIVGIGVVGGASNSDNTHRFYNFQCWGSSPATQNYLVNNFHRQIINTSLLNATQIAGTATNNSATAGNVGEEINAIQSTYTNYTTTATYQNIASITLTAGDWDISAMVTYNSNSATITAAANAIYTISTTTASAAGAVEGQSIGYIPQAALLGTSKFTDVLSPYRVSLSGTTTYYLNTQAAFSVGNPQFVGSIRARRIR